MTKQLYVIAAVIIVMAGGILLWQNMPKLESEDKSANSTLQGKLSLYKVSGEWKTYENSEYGFTLDYPAEWGSIAVISENSNHTYSLQSELLFLPKKMRHY